jgi:hypothetical protein
MFVFKYETTFGMQFKSETSIPRIHKDDDLGHMKMIPDTDFNAKQLYYLPRGSQSNRSGRENTHIQHFFLYNIRCFTK